MHIERFDPAADESRLRTCYDIVVGAQPADDPNAPLESYAGFRGWWIYGMAGVPQQTWLAATDAGEPVGCYVLELPERENRSLAFCHVVVALEARRRGIGTGILAHAAEQAGLEGRVRLMSAARIDAPGSAFATAVGARAGLRDARRVLDVGPALHAQLPDLLAEAAAHSSGYALRRWPGPVPDELVDQACAMFMAMADAPREHNVEPEHWDAARLRAAEMRGVAQGSRSYAIAAISDTSGEMAALTQVLVDPAIGEWAFQDLTVVTRAHRGHRLGLRIKAAMLDWLAEAEPQVRHVRTMNAVTNEHMVAVNDRLGFRVTDYFESFEMDVEAARSLAAAGQR